ncbi:MAG TPA: hypothetical protein VGC50_05560 [Gammaproteobacteria bacterium]
MRWAVKHAATPVIAIVCVILAAATPLMEVIPFSANIAGRLFVSEAGEPVWHASCSLLFEHGIRIFR